MRQGRGFVVSHGGSFCKENAAGIACDCREEQSRFLKAAVWVFT